MQQAGVLTPAFLIHLSFTNSVKKWSIIYNGTSGKVGSAVAGETGLRNEEALSRGFFVYTTSVQQLLIFAAGFCMAATIALIFNLTIKDGNAFCALQCVDRGNTWSACVALLGK